MKKSEYTVTMPIHDYEQFCNYKEKYEELVKSLLECYDTNTHNNFPAEPIRFDPIKANNVCKKLLGIKHQKATIVIQ